MSIAPPAYRGKAALHSTQAERLFREKGDRLGLATSLGDQAVILAVRMNQPRQARALADEAYRLALGCGSGSMAEWIESVRGTIR